MLLAAITFAFLQAFTLWGIHIPKHKWFLCLPTSSCSGCDFYPTFNSPLYMTIHCQFSKTNLFGRGHTLYTCFLLTPLPALLQLWKGTCHSRNMTPMVLFYALGMASLSYTQNLSRCFTSSWRNWASNRSFIQDTVLELGQLSEQQQQVSQSAWLKALGRWSSECYIRCIHTPRKSQQALTLSMAQASNVW